jgi:serine/threonine protein kinase
LNCCTAQAQLTFLFSHITGDLKPENVLIGNSGYPILIDFGFTKKIEGKTFTLCGTPGYLSPEIVSQQGHTFSADHWAFGVLIYEMLCGYSPFYEDGIDPAELYRSIAEDDYDPPINSSAVACDLVGKLLEKDPVLRLGSLAGGESDIASHPWFDGMDPSLVRKQQLEVPWRPDISDPFDVRHFDDWSEVEDKTLGRYPPLKQKQQSIFEDFEVH